MLNVARKATAESEGNSSQNGSTGPKDKNKGELVKRRKLDSSSDEVDSSFASDDEDNSGALPSH